MSSSWDLGGPAAVLHGAVASDARKDELDVLVQAQAVSESLRRLGCEPKAVAMDLDLQAAADRLRRLQPRLVFNLVESIGGRDRLAGLAPILLESLPLAYTGCSSAAVVLSGAKLAAKGLLRLGGVPTPDWLELPGLAAGTGSLTCPAVLKSAWDHASFGLEAVYGSMPELQAALRLRLEAPATPDAPPAAELFAESYIEGREFNLSVLEAQGEPLVLPAAEMRFVDYPEGKPKIVGYAAKWVEGSFEYTHTVRRFDFGTEDAALLDRLADLARRCWRLFALSGYARVDFRVDPAGRPWVLEVNANPCLSPDAGFVAAAGRAGLGYDAVVEHLLAAALRRGAAVGPYGNAARPAGAARSTHPAPPAGAAKSALPAAGPGQSAPGEPGVGASRIRDSVVPGDVAAVRAIVVSSGFFSAAEIELAVELVEERLQRGIASGYHFLFAEPPDQQGEPAGYTCFGPIPCTSSSYDLYWIAVGGGTRGRGLGTGLLRQTEDRIRLMGGRRIYVETSSRPQYEPTRGFYTARGYRVETVLEDFYGPGDGKVIFVKEIA